MLLNHAAQGLTMAISEGIKRGTVALLILSLLKDEDMYGYQLTQELEKRSGGKYSLQESSMYPTLYRLLDNEYISDTPVKAGKRKVRIYYHIEPKGLEYLQKAKEEYLTITAGILNILQVNSLDGSMNTNND